ncbi:MAG: sugar ABC transporter permease [Chloroflexi bacterium]|nr:sugar ABC transporter permease [Chloroflexota bacterium]
MTAATVGLSEKQAPESRVDFWLRLLLIWHVFLGLSSLGGIVYLWFGGAEQSIWVQALGSVALLLTAVFSAIAVVDINKRKHRGRTISLAVNYLYFLFTLFGSMHLIGVFTGIDSLADSFMRGIPFLILLFAGFFIGTLTDRYQNPATQRALRQTSKAVMVVSGVAFLLAVGIHNGVLALLGKLTNPLILAMVGGTAVFAITLWAMWRQPSAEAMQATNADNEMLSGYLFLSPNLLGFLFFFAGPLLLSLYVSFTNSDAFGTQDWIGLDNYARIVNLDIAQLEAINQLASEAIDVKVYDELTRFDILGRSYIVGAQDKLFWLSLRNTLAFVLLAVPLSVIPALILANLLNSKIAGMKIFRAIYFLPSVAAVVGIALVWQWLFNATIGYINYFITVLVNFLNSLGGSFFDPQIRWLSDSNTALLAVVIVAAWQWIGFNTVLFLAGLQNIPRTLYEAATVDGANEWQQFWKVTLPLLAPTTFFVITTTTIQAMQIFEQVFILIPTNPAGPNNSTLTLVLYLYQKGFQRFEQGYASAIAWVLFVIIFGATLFQFQRQRASGSSYDA